MAKKTQQKNKEPHDEARKKIEAATIGTPYILNSEQVQEAPARVNQPVPVPSVYQDERGEIHNFNIGGKRRINLLYSKAGVMRSGDLHKDTQHDFVFTGRVRLWILQKSTGETIKTEYGPCQYVAIDPYTPHIFEFLEDTIVAEWWDGPFFAWFYEPYRQLVQKSFSPTRPGKFSHYALQDRPGRTKLEMIRDNPAVWSALGIGVVVGFVVGRRR